MAVTGRLTHEDARAVIEAASKDELNLPSYRGGSSDLSYLRSYVATNAAKLYGVSASVFNSPTLYSTSLLRDFVHRAVYHNDSTTKHDDLVANGQAASMENDVAAALRYPAYGICGLLGWQMFTVFEAFGYDARRLAANDGAMPRSVAQSDLYVSGHVITEVYLRDLGKFALQDATYNAIYTDESGVPLSLAEVQYEKYIAKRDITFDYTSSYVNYQHWGYKALSEFSKTVQDNIEDIQTNDWFNVPYSWTSQTFNGWNVITEFYSYASSGGLVFSSKASAVEAITDQISAGASWEEAQAAIRSTKAVYGFRLYSRDSGQIVSEWLTVGVMNGTFVSVNMATGQVLNGTYDQLMAEASGSGARRNPGVDLKFMYAPTGFISPNGVVGYDWEAKSFQNEPTVTMGTAGSNLLSSGTPMVALAGGAGDDVYVVSHYGVEVSEGSGGGYDRLFTATTYAMSPTSQVEYLSALYKTTGTDLNLVANRFTRIMVGNNGDNMFYGSETNQKMFGRYGDDIYYVNSRGDSVHELAGQGTDTVFTLGTYVLQLSTAVENLSVMRSTTTNRVNLIGNNLNNILTGNEGSNQLQGRGGKDTLIGLGGNDTYVIDTASDIVRETADNGWDVAFAQVSYRMTAGAHVEVLRVHAYVPASQAITLLGNGLQEQIIGHNGNNVLNPLGGTGTLMIGQGGNDDYYVHSAGDQIVELVGNGTDRVITSVTFTLADGVEIEAIQTAAPDATTAIDLTGNSGAQAITGNAGDNVLTGGGGLDTLTGGDGVDFFVFAAALDPANIVTIADFVSGTDQLTLDNAVFTGLAAGALDGTAFVDGADATAPEHRIVYDSATGNLYFDSDGDGATAKVQFATLTGAPALVAPDFFLW